MNLSFCTGHSARAMDGCLIQSHPPRVPQSFRHHHPTARLESMTDLPAFLSWYQHDDDDDFERWDQAMAAGILVELSHLR